MPCLLVSNTTARLFQITCRHTCLNSAALVFSAYTGERFAEYRDSTVLERGYPIPTIDDVDLWGGSLVVEVSVTSERSTGVAWANLTLPVVFTRLGKCHLAIHVYTSTEAHRREHHPYP
jgi:hypothetical protein